MAHRAAMIGGTFAVEPGPTGGTIVTCSIPLASAKPAKQLIEEHDDDS
jgi:signal transduction histidine kinase